MKYPELARDYSFEELTTVELPRIDKTKILYKLGKSANSQREAAFADSNESYMGSQRTQSAGEEGSQRYEEDDDAQLTNRESTEDNMQLLDQTKVSEEYN
jgi:hypothetical protein